MRDGQLAQLEQQTQHEIEQSDKIIQLLTGALREDVESSLETTKGLKNVIQTIQDEKRQNLVVMEEQSKKLKEMKRMIISKETE